MDLENISNREQKIELAKKIIPYVQDNQTIGFGSGTTSYIATIEIGKLVKNKGWNITAVPTSNEIEKACEEYGIKIGHLAECNLDWAFDGADEVDINRRLIKGKGAAMFREKLNILSSPITYILVDESKFVKKLGENCPVPVEVYSPALKYVSEELIKLGAVDTVFRGVTENGNPILDTKFNEIDEYLEKRIKLIPGVIESGLFIGYSNLEVVTN